MRTVGVEIAAYRDEEGRLAALVRRGGHYYIRTWGRAWEPDAGRVYEVHVASRAAGLAAMRKGAAESDLNCLITLGPLAGQYDGDIWTRGLDDEDNDTDKRARRRAR